MASEILDRHIRLYHWSPTLTGNHAVVDPECFLTQRHHYTLGDWRISSIPRSFFYLNLKHKEKIISGELYSTIIHADDLYDLNSDPLDYRLRSMAGYKSNINVGSMNFTHLLDEIHRELIQTERYNGVYYGKDIKVACMFVPVEVEKAVLV